VGGVAVTWLNAAPCADVLDVAWHPAAGPALLHGIGLRILGCTTTPDALRVRVDPLGAVGFDSTALTPRARIAAHGDGYLVLRPDGGGVVRGHLLGSDGTVTLDPVLDVTGGLPLSDDNADPPRGERGGDGATLLVWSSGSDETKVYGRLLLADGTFAGAPVALASTDTGTLAAPDVAATADGDYLVVWGRENLGEREVRGRFVSAAGLVLDADFRLGTFLTSSDRGFTAPRVSTSRRGALVVWVSHDLSLDRDVLLGTFLPRRVD
jgi:hypothetical protein